jgi:hypothetical protein
MLIQMRRINKRSQNIRCSLMRFIRYLMVLESTPKLRWPSSSSR